MTGAAEPHYGKKAFRAIDDVVEGKNPYGALHRDDLNWRSPHYSNVETETFYFEAASGHYGFVQVIHSNPVGIHNTAQFTCMIRHDSKPEESVWTSTSLENFHIKGTDFHSDGCSITLNEAADEYTISSVVNEESLIEVKVKRKCLGFKIGEDGSSLYGEDLKHPWGSMRHVFWPRTYMTGKAKIKGHELDLNEAQGMYVMALQGMKPHHAASKWNFLNFQGPTFSAILMEFTTPHSYDEQKSSIGSVVHNDELISTAAHCRTVHRSTKTDDVGWPVPTDISFEINGPKIESSDADISKNMVKATVSGAIPHMVDRVDVMAEIPSFLKKVAHGVSGTKPYIYQFCNKLHIKVVIDGKTYEEEGFAYTESTFIS